MARHGRALVNRPIVNRFRGDTVQPVYTAGPSVAAVSSSTVDAVATATSDLGAPLDHYVGLYAAGSTPTRTQVFQGTGTGFIQGTSVLGVSSGAQATFPQLTGIASNGKQYRLAFTANDQYNVLAGVTYVDFYTTIGPATRGEADVTGFLAALFHPKTVTVPFPLALRTGVARASLSSLHWAWFDTSDVDSMTTPTDHGTAETTDGSGNLDVYLTNSVLTTGQYGLLALQTSDKLSTALYLLQIP